MQNLQNIFESITPDNIKNIPAIKDAMAIFIETLEELSKESIDIRKMFLNPVIKEELVKIYLDDLYKVFKTLQFNQKVVEKIERLNTAYGIEYYKVDVILNIAKYINEEHFLTFKSYKEKKGTEDAIKYIYELVGRKLLSEDSKVPFTLTEVQPFIFNISGNLPSELYEAVVRPLAHPLGFVYQYDQLVSLLLEDIFLSTLSYKTNALETRCLLPDGTTSTTDYKYESDGVTPRVVVDIQTSQTSIETTRKILFADGRYIEQHTTPLGQTTVHYKESNGVMIVAYDVYQCSLYFDYEVVLTTTVQEDFNSVTNGIPIDYYARLNPANNALSNIETGFNSTRNIDGDYLFSSAINMVIGAQNAVIGDEYSLGELPAIIGAPDTFIGNIHTIGDNYLILDSIGRHENFFQPSTSADLKMLEGKFERDVVILHPITGAYFETQSIKYTDVVNLANQVAPFVQPQAVYDAQNIENANNIFKEHFIIQDNAIFANQNAPDLTYINAETILIGSTGINIGHLDGLGNTYNIYNTYTNINDDNVYRYFYPSYSNDEPVNMGTSIDDIFDCSVTRDGVVLADNNVSALG